MELDYPGDPSGSPRTVYNCRCSMRSHIIGIRQRDGRVARIEYTGDTPTMHARQIAVDTFKATEFVPLIGEEDGYTDYIWRLGRHEQLEEGEILHPKRPYVQIVGTSEADGEEILDGQNYPGFPIVPLWANLTHQSELVGLREKIDGYDLQKAV